MKRKTNGNKSKKRYGLALAMFLGGATLSVPMHVEAAEKFDPAFYAATYADVVNALGTESKALYDHYLTYGQKEGRKAYPGAKGGEVVEGIADTKAQIQETPTETSVNGLVALEKLPHLKSLKKKCTDEEFRAAYDVAAGVVTPLMGMSREDQLYQISGGNPLQGGFRTGILFHR